MVSGARQTLGKPQQACPSLWLQGSQGGGTSASPLLVSPKAIFHPTKVVRKTVHGSLLPFIRSLWHGIASPQGLATARTGSQLVSWCGDNQWMVLRAGNERPLSLPFTCSPPLSKCGFPLLSCNLQTCLSLLNPNPRFPLGSQGKVGDSVPECFPPPTQLMGPSLWSPCAWCSLKWWSPGEAWAGTGKESGQTLPGDTEPHIEGVKNRPAPWCSSQNINNSHRM